MSRTTKIERARALHKGPDMAQFHGMAKPKRPHKQVELIPTGQPQGLYDGTADVFMPRHVDNGGVRYGNQRAMRAALKVTKRRKERRMANHAIHD